MGELFGVNVKVLCFSSQYLPGYKGGGPIKTIKNLFDQACPVLDFWLVTSDRDLGDKEPYSSINCGEWNVVGNAWVYYVQAGRRGFLQIANILKNDAYDIVYLNSFFSIRFSFFPLLLAKLLKRRVVLGPRGEFSKGALEIKLLKKKIFIRLFKLFRFHRGVVFQASSEFEEADIRTVLGESVDIRVAEDIGTQEFIREFPVRSANMLEAVFVSRISPKKNLLAALEMIHNVGKPLRYDIFGPIEDRDYWAQCEEKIASLPSHVQVEYKGELNPDQIINTMAKYDVFLMPTKGENYGHVVAEALCAGLPLLIADTTPWRHLQELGIGWDLPLSNPGAFSSVLDELATMSRDEHRRMRETVLVWAKKKFAQKDAIDANIEMFRYAYEKKGNL